MSGTEWIALGIGTGLFLSLAVLAWKVIHP